ncbi:Crp/Fnr family transcriptional regulator [Chitinophaga solisilvae]|uniref:Crp/Fnr family transcriptional regulator n=1 Tax=Chitinophaga solisilvae TaxID=1233460 RepID=A0A3S1D4R5_9BACT|nr:Crp/Fnr family transcriptional regulator [Chitinophaga solisilvae]NSL85749.1 Crp/Fnr family transcriptional regulator [Chitinophaga solisilvae]
MKQQEGEIARLLAAAFQDEALYNAYYQVAEERVFRRGEVLLEQGKVCRHCYNIISGLVRVFYLKDGKDITTAFCFADDTVFSIESATRQTPCPETYEVLEDSVIEVIAFEDLNRLRQEFPVLEKVWTLSMEAYAIWLEERVYSMQFCSARERYQQLLQKYPEIILQARLTHIASYLGITLETLSRIRAQAG